MPVSHTFLAFFGAAVVACAYLLQPTHAMPSPTQQFSNDRNDAGERLLQNLRDLENLLIAQSGQGGISVSDQAASDGERQTYELPRDYNALLERLEGMRRLRRRQNKRNYNLDHLARMNFRRSYRDPSAVNTRSLNNRHIIGGLRK